MTIKINQIKINLNFGIILITINNFENLIINILNLIINFSNNFIFKIKNNKNSKNINLYTTAPSNGGTPDTAKPEDKNSEKNDDISESTDTNANDTDEKNSEKNSENSKKNNKNKDKNNNDIVETEKGTRPRKHSDPLALPGKKGRPAGSKDKVQRVRKTKSELKNLDNTKNNNKDSENSDNSDNS